MSRRLVVLTAALALSAGGRASAQTTAGTFVFATVDSVALSFSAIKITGVLQGEAQPTTVSVSVSSSSTTSPVDGMAAGLLQSCERLALLAMTKPGQFVFTVTSPVTLANSATCKLAPAAL